MRGPSLRGLQKTIRRPVKDYQRATRGSPDDQQRTTRGPPEDYQRTTREIRMGHQWVIRDQPEGHQRATRGPPEDYHSYLLQLLIKTQLFYYLQLFIHSKRTARITCRSAPILQTDSRVVLCTHVCNSVRGGCCWACVRLCALVYHVINEKVCFRSAGTKDTQEKNTKKTNTQSKKKRAKQKRKMLYRILGLLPAQGKVEDKELYICE